MNSVVDLNNNSLIDNSEGIEIEVPGSKSITNRVILMAALGKGTCRIRGFLLSEDTQVCLGIYVINII